MPGRRWAFALLLCCTTSALAADVYRWVGPDGKVNFTDTVPEAYKKSAVKVSTTPAVSSDQSQADAAAAAARAKQKAATQFQTAHPAESPDAQSANPADSQPPPAPSCQALIQAYQTSQACFSNYKNANGSTKAIAYQHCKEMVDPSPQCGSVVQVPR